MQTIFNSIAIGFRCENIIPSPTTTTVRKTIQTTTDSTIKTTQSTITPTITTSTSITEEVITSSKSTLRIEPTLKSIFNMSSTTLFIPNSTPNNEIEVKEIVGIQATTVPTIKHSEFGYTSVIPNIPSTENPTEFTTLKNTKSTALTSYKTMDFTTKPYTTIKPEIISKIFLPTTKFKPKEIWIKPTQKGDSSSIDKLKVMHDVFSYKSKGATGKEFYYDTSTPRTIIVSIIPTSIAYSTYKKMSLTTTPYQKEANETQIINSNFTTSSSRKSISNYSNSTPMISRNNSRSTTVNPLLFQNISKSILPFTKKSTTTASSKPYSTTFNTKYLSTNSMTVKPNIANTSQNVSSNNVLTTIIINATRVHSKLRTTLPAMTATVREINKSSSVSTRKPNITSNSTDSVRTTVHASIAKQSFTLRHNYNTTRSPIGMTKLSHVNQIISGENESTIRKGLYELTTINDLIIPSTTNTVMETTSLAEDETFHILTEPEHITAVVGDKSSDKRSMDLLSVLSIAGGVMLAIITVAVIIVMIERCKRPRYQEVRKMNDINMKVMIENSEIPPPYMRSIFHAPLPGKNKIFYL